MSSKRKILIGLCLLMSFLFVHFKCTNTFVIPDQKFDVIIVLGNKLSKNGTPSLFLGKRLDTAIFLFENNIGKAIIFSGKGSRSNYDEASVMAAYCKINGMASKHFIIEDESMSTFENVKYSEKKMNELGYTSALVVTSKFHRYRSEQLFNKKSNYYKVIGAKENFATYLLALPQYLIEGLKLCYHYYYDEL